MTNPGDETWVNAADAVLVVEIMSPGGERKDRGHRARDYAKAGIAYYLRVELRGEGPQPTMVLDKLVDGEYVPCAAAT